MIPYKKHPFIKGGFQISRGIKPREIIGPIVKRTFPSWPPKERIIIPPFREPPHRITIPPFREPPHRITIPPFREPPHRITIPPYKSLPKKIISTGNAYSDSGLIGAGIGAILSILSFLL